MNGLGDLDDALEVFRLLEPDFLGLPHDPQPDRNQIRPQPLRQIVLGLGKILDEDGPQLAYEEQRFHCLARFRAGLVRGLQ